MTVEPTQRDDQEPASPTTPELSGKGAARRRIGLGVSGVIMTLASKPGMAGMYCGSISGWNSASTASKTKVASGSCMGLSAGYWINSRHTWPSGCSRTAMFSTIFPQGKGTAYTDSSLINVLTNTSTTADKSNLRREFVCAYLNALSGRNTHPSILELKAIWLAYAPTLSYTVPSTGEVLSTEKLKYYLAASHD